MNNENSGQIVKEGSRSYRFRYQCDSYKERLLKKTPAIKKQFVNKIDMPNQPWHRLISRDLAVIDQDSCWTSISILIRGQEYDAVYDALINLDQDAIDNFRLEWAYTYFVKKQKKNAKTQFERLCKQERDSMFLVNLAYIAKFVFEDDIASRDLLELAEQNAEITLHLCYLAEPWRILFDDNQKIHSLLERAKVDAQCSFDFMSLAEVHKKLFDDDKEVCALLMLAETTASDLYHICDLAGLWLRLFDDKNKARSLLIAAGDMDNQSPSRLSHLAKSWKDLFGDDRAV